MLLAARLKGTIGAFTLSKNKLVHTRPTFIGPASNERRVKVEQKLGEVFKRFRRDSTFFRTKEKSYGSRATKSLVKFKLDSTRSIQQTFDFFLALSTKSQT